MKGILMDVELMINSTIAPGSRGCYSYIREISGVKFLPDGELTPAPKHRQLWWSKREIVVEFEFEVTQAMHHKH